MKRVIFLLLIFFMVFVSCSKKEEESVDSSQLGGDPNIALNTIGNKFTPSISIYGSPVEIESSIEIIASENGVNTLKFIADLSQSYELSMLNEMIPAGLKDSQGRVNVEASFMATSEGMLDYTNRDGSPFVAVKYDCKVGDQYKLHKSDGSTITRTVMAKSTVDDFYYGFMLIKTISVEQDSRIPGICKIIYRFNHNFGLVAVDVVTEDDEVFSVIIFPTYP